MTDFNSDIKTLYEFIKTPDVILDDTYDFLVILTQIYQENNLLRIYIDVDECDYIKKEGYITGYCSKYGECVEPLKYYAETFKDLQTNSTNNFINAINSKKDYQLIKTFDNPLEDNTLFVQINVIITSTISKFIKSEIERPIIFFLNNEKIAKYNKHGIKEYFDLSYFEKTKQQEIIDILNSYYDYLTIIKKPSTNDLIFEIKGQEFIKRIWHKYEQQFYPIINEKIKL